MCRRSKGLLQEEVHLLKDFFVLMLNFLDLLALVPYLRLLNMVGIPILVRRIIVLHRSYRDVGVLDIVVRNVVVVVLNAVLSTLT